MTPVSPPPRAAMSVVYTVGHSTRSAGELF